LRLAILQSDLGGAGNRFAQSVAVRDDIRRRKINETEYREVEPGRGRRVRARRKFDIGVGSRSARPFHIECGFSLIAVLAGIGAAGINLLEVAVRELVQTEGLTEVLPILGMKQIAIFDAVRIRVPSPPWER
jgi:hypothetical protein